MAANQEHFLEPLTRLFSIIIASVETVNQENAWESYAWDDVGAVCSDKHMKAYSSLLRNLSPFLGIGDYDRHIEWVPKTIKTLILDPLLL